jgi:hypothetical protein
MKTKKYKVRVVTASLFCILALYPLSYATLRLTKLLVAQQYTVLQDIENGDLLISEHFDIDQGPAFVDDQLQSRSILSIIYSPISAIEVRLRGYSDYPRNRIYQDRCIH